MSENINREIYTELANRIYDLDAEVYRVLGSSLGRTFTGNRDTTIRTLSMLMYTKPDGHLLRSELALISNMARTIKDPAEKSRLMTEYDEILKAIEQLPNMFGSTDILDAERAALNLAVRREKISENDHLVICISRTQGSAGNDIGFELADWIFCQVSGFCQCSFTLCFCSFGIFFTPEDNLFLIYLLFYLFAGNRGYLDRSWRLAGFPLVFCTKPFITFLFQNIVLDAFFCAPDGHTENISVMSGRVDRVPDVITCCHSFVSNGNDSAKIKLLFDASKVRSVGQTVIGISGKKLISNRNSLIIHEKSHLHNWIWTMFF